MLLRTTVLMIMTAVVLENLIGAIVVLLFIMLSLLLPLLLCV